MARARLLFDEDDNDVEDADDRVERGYDTSE